MFREVQEFITHLVVTSNGKASIAAAKFVAYREGLIATIAFILELLTRNAYL